MIRDLVDDGWSLVIYPEGGRSPDGWGQEFKGGAAYLSARTGAPVVPVFIDGTGAIFGKGMKRPKPGRTKVVVRRAAAADRGREHPPLQRPHRGRRDDARRRGADRLLDGPPARRRPGTSPVLGGPEYTGWRRQWELTDAPPPGHRRPAPPPKRRWPDLG